MLTLLIKHNAVDACTDNKHRLSSVSKGIYSYPKNRGSCVIKTDLQKASWGVTGWHVGLLPDQESLTGHHLLWNRIAGRQSASPAAHAQRCDVYIRYIYISLMLAQIHMFTSRNSLRDFWQRCSWSSILTSAILMPALVLRERTLLSLWISDIMDLRHTKISFIKYHPSETDMEDN